MIILVNGAFGVGKTTVARLLVDLIPKSTLFDPEVIGFVLQRLPAFIPLSGHGTGDFQDFLLWRQLTSLNALALHKVTGRKIIIPMTFSKLEYLNQIRSKLSDKDVAVHHFCLTAPVHVVYERLKNRGVKPSSAKGLWIYPRAAKCCEIHKAPEVGEHTDTNKRLPDEIANKIWKRIKSE